MIAGFLSPLSVSSFTAPVIGPHRNALCTRVPTMSEAKVKAVADPVARPASKASDVSESFTNNVMNTYVRFPLAISHGKGAELFDLDGNRYLDCVAGIATCTLGHAHPSVVEAVSKQVSRTAHVSNLYYIPEQASLAEWLVRHSPADKVFFCNSGAEANEAAIKLARKRWHLKKGSTPEVHGNPMIITAEQSFHGRTLATLTATGQPKYHANWWPLVPGFEHVRFNDEAQLREMCERIGDDLAGIILEPVQGEGGVRPASLEFLTAARELCDAAGALLIFDEVQVGMGRTGSLWAFEQTAVTPDVFTLAKGLGGGVPIGAMLAQKHCDVFAPGDHASTFGGNPLATAAGYAVATELVDGGVLNNVRARGQQLEDGLKKIAQSLDSVITDIRGKGLIRGVELNGLKAGDVVKHAMGNGLLLVPAGPTVVRFVPPLIISETEIDEVLEKFRSALTAVVK